MKLEFEAIGTHWIIDLKTKNLNIKKIILDRISLFEQGYSRFKANSLVSQGKIPDDAQPLLELYKNLYEITDKKFNLFMRPTLESAGYDANYSLKIKTLIPPPDWETGIKNPKTWDVGAAGKGYLVDIISNLLQENGFENFTIDAGGDIYTTNQIQIGLENPKDPKQAIGIVTIRDLALCGSAGNRRTWGDFHHTIDPQNLKSPNNILAIWTVAKTTMIADALTTCLYFSSAQKLKTRYNFEYLILYPDFKIEKSLNFPAEIFYKNE